MSTPKEKKMENFIELFPVRLKTIMHDLNLSQVKLAEICNVKQQTVSEWLRGDCLPSLPTFYTICTKLSIDPGALMGIKWPRTPRVRIHSQGII